MGVPAGGRSGGELVVDDVDVGLPVGFELGLPAVGGVGVGLDVALVEDRFRQDGGGHARTRRRSYRRDEQRRGGEGADGRDRWVASAWLSPACWFCMVLPPVRPLYSASTGCGLVQDGPAARIRHLP